MQFLLAALSLVVFFGAWQFASTSGLIDPALFPPPTDVFDEAISMARSGMLMEDTLASLRRAAVGFLLGGVLGVLLGAATGRLPTARALLEPIVQLFRPIPSIALVPLAVIWFGLGEAPKVFLISYAVFFPAWLNTHVGVGSVDRSLIWAAQSLGCSRRRLFREVIIWWALPYVLAGLRLGVSLAFIVLVAAEMTGASAGLGFRITQASLVYRTDQMLVAIVVLGIIGALADRLFYLATRHMTAGSEN